MIFATGLVFIGSGIVGWWPADDDAGDVLGNNPGLLQSGATFAPGKVGNAFELNGKSAHVRIRTDSGLTIVDRATMLA